MWGACWQMIVLPALLPVLFAWRQLLLGWIKHQLYNHNHVRELYLNVGGRKRVEQGKYHRKEQAF